jgi:hypothetical protein
MYYGNRCAITLSNGVEVVEVLRRFPDARVVGTAELYGGGQRWIVEFERATPAEPGSGRLSTPADELPDCLREYDRQGGRGVLAVTWQRPTDGRSFLAATSERPAAFEDMREVAREAIRNLRSNVTIWRRTRAGDPWAELAIEAGAGVVEAEAAGDDEPPAATSALDSTVCLAVTALDERVGRNVVVAVWRDDVAEAASRKWAIQFADRLASAGRRSVEVWDRRGDGWSLDFCPVGDVAAVEAEQCSHGAHATDCGRCNGVPGLTDVEDPRILR